MVDIDNSCARLLPIGHPWRLAWRRGVEEVAMAAKHTDERFLRSARRMARAGELVTRDAALRRTRIVWSLGASRCVARTLRAAGWAVIEGGARALGEAGPAFAPPTAA